MEKGQSDVTDKIRSAIRKKLVDINAFVDDELPEYIMILVANKRSKAHIEKDLSLFLGCDTKYFTDWLWDLLNQLKVGSKVNSDVKSDGLKSKQKDDGMEEDADVLDYDPNEQEGDFLCQEDSIERESNVFSSLPTNSGGNEIFKVTDINPLGELQPTTSELTGKGFNQRILSQERDEHNFRETPVNFYPQQEISRPMPCSTIVPVKRKEIIDSGDEYDPTKPDYVGSISSVVCVTQRKYGGPAALQSNKLLLKAVKDANDSVKDHYKPTPIKVLSSKRYENRLFPGQRNRFNSKIDIDYSMKSKPVSQNAKHLLSGAGNTHSNIATFVDKNFLSPSVANNSRTICLTTPDSSMHSDVVENMTPVNSTDEFSFSDLPDNENSKSPHFIVTLEGVNLPSLKRKCNSSVGSLDEEDSILEEAFDSEPDKKQKLSERCKYWPACKNSDHCAYHHPTAPCKCFPDCKYGDKCLYIHPNCKFDALCSRKDCPYTHASKRKLPFSQPVTTNIPLKSRNIRTVCKFYPKCTSKKCPFIHPKLCRYGTQCRSPKCPYSHFHVPSRNQMKWQANEA